MPVIEDFVKKHFSTSHVSKENKQVLKEITSPITKKNQASGVEAHKEEDHTTIMEREIFEQPESLRRTMQGRVDFKTKRVNLTELDDGTSAILRCKRIIVVGSGSSYHVAIATRQLLEEMVELPVFIELASDFLDREVPIFRNDVCVFLSQSGETTNVVEACRYCLKRDALTIAITNTADSNLAHMCQYTLDINAGTELGVTSTKTYTSEFLTMTLFSLHLAYDKKTKTERMVKIIDELERLPGKVEHVLKATDKYRKTAILMKDEDSILVMGRGYQQATCMEGSFKFKEVTNLHSEGIHCGELKHGPLALIDDRIPIIMIVMRDAIYDKCCNAIQQVKARGGKPILICEDSDTETRKWAHVTLGVPTTIDCLAGILTIIPLQLLSLYLAESMDKNVDHPPGLVKAVIEKYIPNRMS